MESKKPPRCWQKLCEFYANPPSSGCSRHSKENNFYVTWTDWTAMVYFIQEVNFETFANCLNFCLDQSDDDQEGWMNSLYLTQSYHRQHNSVTIPRFKIFAEFIDKLLMKALHLPAKFPITFGEISEMVSVLKKVLIKRFPKGIPLTLYEHLVAYSRLLIVPLPTKQQQSFRSSMGMNGDLVDVYEKDSHGCAQVTFNNEFVFKPPIDDLKSLCQLIPTYLVVEARSTMEFICHETGLLPICMTYIIAYAVRPAFSCYVEME